MRNRNFLVEIMPQLSVSQDGFNYIDANGNYLFNENLLEATCFNSEGVAIIKKKNGKIFFIDKFGKPKYDIGFDAINKMLDFSDLELSPTTYLVYRRDIDKWNIVGIDGCIKHKTFFTFERNKYDDEEFEPYLDTLLLSPVIKDENNVFNLIAQNSDFISQEWFIDYEYLNSHVIKFKRKNGTYKLINLSRAISPYDYTEVIRTENPLLFIVRRINDGKMNVIDSQLSFLFQEWKKEIEESNSYDLEFNVVDKDNIAHVFSFLLNRFTS